MPAAPPASPFRPVARTWRGATRLEYLKGTGFRSYRETPGNLAVLALRRRQGDRAEFLLITLWESEDAIRRFAGDPIGRAIFYPEDDRFLVDRDTHVDHFEVVFQDGGVAP